MPICEEEGDKKSSNRSCKCKPWEFIESKEMIAVFSNTDARISITVDFRSGKGNKTPLPFFKPGRLFWVMGERLSVRHATLNRWYVSVLVSEQTRSEEDYGSINYRWRKKWKDFVKRLSTLFPPKVLKSLMRQLVARGGRGGRGAARTRGMSIDPPHPVGSNSLQRPFPFVQTLPSVFL